MKRMQMMMALAFGIAATTATMTVNMPTAHAGGYATSTYTTQVVYEGNCRYEYLYRLYKYSASDGGHWHYVSVKRTCYPY